VTCYATEDAVQIVNWFIYNLTLNNHLFRCVTFTQLTILHANIPPRTSRDGLLPRTLCVWLLPRTAENSPCLAPAANFPRRSPPANCVVAPMVFKITPLHRPHGKRVAPLLSVCLLSCCLAMVTAQTTENQLRNSHSAISLALIAA
jgi:hypothetical protein